MDMTQVDVTSHNGVDEKDGAATDDPKSLPVILRIDLYMCDQDHKRKTVVFWWI
jgi:hypothetical protein